MSLAVIGLFVLWLGWFGFNPGSTMSFQQPADVAHILMTTNTAAIAAVLTSTITSWIFIGKPDLGMTINGCLSGLVGITGGCAYVTVGASLLLLGVQLLGVITVGAFVFLSSLLVWVVIKKLVGIRVSRDEEIEGLDIGEHGNIAYPDFAPVTTVTELVSSIEYVKLNEKSSFETKKNVSPKDKD